MSVENETYTDLFGNEYQICDLREGFTHRARYTLKYVVLTHISHARTYLSRKLHFRAVFTGQNVVAGSLLAVTAQEDEEGTNPERHTQVGFEKRKVPGKLWTKIKAFHQNISDDQWEPGELTFDLGTVST